ncbi:MAG: hypothetical protein AB1898_07695 [Acidobacteriota bacterium]
MKKLKISFLQQQAAPERPLHQVERALRVCFGQPAVALLRKGTTDTFTNPGGDPIPFLRDAAGRIVAFEEGDEIDRRSHGKLIQRAVAGE